MSTPFFTFFRYFFLPPQKKEKAALFPWNQSCLFHNNTFFSHTYLSCLFYWFYLSFRFCRYQYCIPVQILFCSCPSGCSFPFCLFCYCFCPWLWPPVILLFSRRASLAVIVCLVFLILFAFLLLGFFSVSSLLYNKKEGCPSPCRNLIFNCLLFRCTAPYGTP